LTLSLRPCSTNEGSCPNVRFADTCFPSVSGSESDSESDSGSRLALPRLLSARRRRWRDRPWMYVVGCGVGESGRVVVASACFAWATNRSWSVAVDSRIFETDSLIAVVCTISHGLRRC
jgi:hypothetical protein